MRRLHADQTDKMLSRKEAASAMSIFNNPERHNAVSLDMWEAIAAHPRRLRADDEVRVVVLTGAGGKAFVSGADISRFERRARHRGGGRALQRRRSSEANSACYEFPKPTIAMIRGYCIGGGLGLALCCDLRICRDNSHFGCRRPSSASATAIAGSSGWSTSVGPSFTKEIFFTARQFDAAEARDDGPGQPRRAGRPSSRAYVKDYAETIAGNAPLTVNAVKFIVSEALKDESKRDLDALRRSVAQCFASQDYIEGRTAFMEKRKPVQRN